MPDRLASFSGFFRARFTYLQNGHHRIELLEKLTSEQAEKINESVKLIKSFHRGFTINVRIAFDDVQTEISEAEARLSSHIALTATNSCRPIYKALNMSIVIQLYVEHAKSFLDRTWGIDSEKRMKAEEIFHSIFDTYLAYRILYALRNPIVHTDLQLVTMKYSSKLVEVEGHPDTTENEVSLFLSREKILNVRCACSHSLRSEELGMRP
jgi:hypothetical protein